MNLKKNSTIKRNELKVLKMNQIAEIISFEIIFYLF